MWWSRWFSLEWHVAVCLCPSQMLVVWVGTLGFLIFIAVYWMVCSKSSLGAWVKSFLRSANVLAGLTTLTQMLTWEHLVISYEIYVWWSTSVYLIWNICCIVFTLVNNGSSKNLLPDNFFVQKTYWIVNTTNIIQYFFKINMS